MNSSQLHAEHFATAVVHDLDGYIEKFEASHGYINHPVSILTQYLQHLIDTYNDTHVYS